MKFSDNYIKNLQPETDWLEKIESTGLGLRVCPAAISLGSTVSPITAKDAK